MQHSVDQSSVDFRPDSMCEKGTLTHILESSQYMNGKIMLSRCIPMVLSGVERLKFSSDYHAWFHTVGLPFCKVDDLFPTRNMMYGCAGTSNSLKSLGSEPHGLCLCMKIKAGRVLLIIARPRDHICGFLGFARKNIYLDGFNPTSIDPKQFSMECLLL